MPKLNRRDLARNALNIALIRTAANARLGRLSWSCAGVIALFIAAAPGCDREMMSGVGPSSSDGGTTRPDSGIVTSMPDGGALATFTVATMAGTGGTIAPSSVSVPEGSTATLAVIPNAGFAIQDVTGCGGTRTNDQYTTGPIMADCTVSATFFRAHTVTAVAMRGGTLTPTSQVVADGQTAMLQLAVTAEFGLASVTGCGGLLTGTTYTTAAITADCTVTAAFHSYSRVYAGGSHTCAIRSDDAVKCWGSNSSGQLATSSFSLTAHGDEAGEGPATNAAIDVPVAGLRLTSISLGSAHTCAIWSDGNVYCAGENGNGQLGIGTNVDSKTMSVAVDLGGVRATQVSSGGRHTCALLTGGSVRCWGENSSGELGTGNVDSTLVPAPAVAFPMGTIVVEVAAGFAHTCARTADHKVYCWGDNSSGQLGDNNGGVDSATPSTVTLPLGEVKKLDSGNLFSCIIIGVPGAATNVHCWGENGSGQLGNNDGTNTDLDVLTAALDLGGETPVDLALGGEHACALTASGRVYCWGESDAGQTGQNDTTDDLAPQRVFFEAAYTPSQLTAGNDHTCVRLEPVAAGDTTRPIRCWGEGGVGQLGLQDTSDIGDNEIVANPAFNIFP